jgi:hypothetical protein
MGKRQNRAGQNTNNRIGRLPQELAVLFSLVTTTDTEPFSPTKEN